MLPKKHTSTYLSRSGISSLHASRARSAVVVSHWSAYTTNLCSSHILRELAHRYHISPECLCVRYFLYWLLGQFNVHPVDWRLYKQLLQLAPVLLYSWSYFVNSDAAIKWVEIMCMIIRAKSRLYRRACFFSATRIVTEINITRFTLWPTRGHKITIWWSPRLAICC